VLAAKVFGEPRADEAQELIGDGELFEPALLAYELTNVPRTKSRRNPDLVALIARSLAQALYMEIAWVEVDRSAVLRLALETGLTAHDASYLYVARAMSLPLVTFDERLGAAGDQAGVWRGRQQVTG
jgi:predicted nucleic acid-binding protein